jgi:glycosyltransferase involved in cell wall biosynthesis
MNPMISICIPAYRARAHLQEALDSVRTQAFADWELIVTEDGSNDGTEGLVTEFSKSVAQPVHFQRHEENKGLPAARNTGITTARGEYIALLDADDRWTADHLERVFDKLHGAGADIAHGGSFLFDSNSGETVGLRAPSESAVRDFPLSLFEAEYIIQPSSVILKRELWRRVGGFDESFRYVEDREMWLRCARAGAKFAFSGTFTCYYRRHAAALSTHGAEMALASARVLDRHLDWAAIPQELRQRRAADAWTAAARIVQRSEPRRACEYLERAQKISPRLRRSLWSTAVWLYAIATLK